MRAAEEAYVRKVRSLERRQNFHRFYLFHGVAVSSLLIFVAVILAVKLDERGWTRSAYTLMSTVMVSCFLAPVYFVINLFILRRWQCPRCRTETVGWVQKEPQCFSCGLELRTDKALLP
jgi:hypothetical protein